MAMLSREAFERAVRFLQEQARPLEAACFRHSFGEAPATSVVKALAAYQNGDGGYGRALEPDLRTPSSSALATSLALLRLAALGVGGKHPQVQAARAYLERSLDPQRWTWRIVPDDVGAYPHAPWWGQAGLEERFGRYLVNPRAALVAGLLHFEDTLDGDWLGQVAEDTVRAVETRELDMHELLAALALLEAPGLAVGSRARVRAACEQAAERLVATEPEAWAGYGLAPVQVAPRPDSPLHHLFAEVVHVNLDVLVAAQGEEGAWSPNWSWGAYPDAWAEAQREWQGVLTLEALEALRAYGRIEDVTWRAAASNGG
ncbi:MAG: hypothetical protein P8Z81_12305 [Deinococcales bacterium]